VSATRKQKHHESKEPPVAIARPTRLPFGRTPRTVTVEGVPILIVDAEEMARIRGKASRTITLDDLDEATPIEPTLVEQ
jgi:hypothetical protein